MGMIYKGVGWGKRGNFIPTARRHSKLMIALLAA